MSTLERPLIRHETGRVAPLTRAAQPGWRVFVSRQFASRVGGLGLGALTLLLTLLLPLLVIALAMRAYPLLQNTSLSNVFGMTWNPAQGAFGLMPFIIGSLAVTLLALIVAIPLSVGSAIYLVQYLRERQRSRIRPFIELLAGVPSVVYGAWGVLVIVPAVRGLALATGAEQTTGYSILSGALVLALMVTPFMIALMEEVMRAVPNGVSDAAICLGATRWEVVRDVLFRRARGGLIAATGLGFARAFGETLAVLMVIGNVAKVPASPFDPAYPLPALIANNFGEMMSVPLYDAALMSAALILLIVVLAFNLGSRMVVRQVAQHG